MFLALICSEFEFVCNNAATLEKASFFWDIRFISSIGLLVAVITFIIERRLAYISHEKRVRENWFLNIIVIPNLKRIDSFYDDVCKTLRTSHDLLVDSSSLPHNQFLELVSTHNNQFNIIRRQFMNDFVTLVKVHSYPLSVALNNTINLLNDLYTSHLDKIDIQSDSKIPLDDVENKILLNKAQLTNELFKSLRQ